LVTEARLGRQMDVEEKGTDIAGRSAADGSASRSFDRARARLREGRWWMMSTLWIILTGSLVAISCGILGSFLVLRRLAMVGDAISHAILPGIVIAFLFSGSRDSLVMLLGASLIGLVTVFLIQK